MRIFNPFRVRRAYDDLWKITSSSRSLCSLRSEMFKITKLLYFSLEKWKYATLFFWSTTSRILHGRDCLSSRTIIDFPQSISGQTSEARERERSERRKNFDFFISLLVRIDDRIINAYRWAMRSFESKHKKLLRCRWWCRSNMMV